MPLTRPAPSLVNDTPGLLVLLASERGIELRFVNSFAAIQCKPPNMRIPIAAITVREGAFAKRAGLKKVHGQFFPYDAVPDWVKRVKATPESFRRATDAMEKYLDDVDRVLSRLHQVYA